MLKLFLLTEFWIVTQCLPQVITLSFFACLLKHQFLVITPYRCVSRHLRNHFVYRLPHTVFLCRLTRCSFVVLHLFKKWVHLEFFIRINHDCLPIAYFLLHLQIGLALCLGLLIAKNGFQNYVLDTAWNIMVKLKHQRAHCRQREGLRRGQRRRSCALYLSRHIDVLYDVEPFLGQCFDVLFVILDDRNQEGQETGRYDGRQVLRHFPVLWVEEATEKESAIQWIHYLLQDILNWRLQLPVFDGATQLQQT